VGPEEFAVLDAATGAAPAAGRALVLGEKFRDGVAYMMRSTGPDFTSEIHAIEVASGKSVWRVDPVERPRVTRLVDVDGGSVYVLDAGTRLLVLDRATGRTVRRWDLGYARAVVVAPRRGAGPVAVAAVGGRSLVAFGEHAAAPLPARIAVEGTLHLGAEPPVDPRAIPIHVGGTTVSADADGRFAAEVEAQGAVVVVPEEGAVRGATKHDCIAVRPAFVVPDGKTTRFAVEVSARTRFPCPRDR
jgi:outer membrane protein assembly factor BamB